MRIFNFLIYYYFILSVIISISYCDEVSRKNIKDEKESKSQWLNAGSEFEQISWPLKNSFTRFIQQRLADSSSISEKCQNGLEYFTQNLDTNQLWAIEMFDSFSKFKPGIFNDKFADFGHYEQCLRVKNERFLGRYTLFHVQWPMPTKAQKRTNPEELRNIVGNETWISGMANKVYYFYFEPMVMAVCSPSTCSNSDIESLISSVNQVSSFNIKLISTESIDDNPERSILSTVSGTVLISLALITITSTVYYWYNGEQSDSWFKYFDAVSNSRKLLLETRNPRLSFLNGMKFVYLVMCICSHLYLPMSHGFKSFYFLSERFIQGSSFAQSYGATAASYLAVNMIIGSSLSMITWLPEIEKRKGKVSFTSFVLIRYLRSIPVVAACIMILVSFPTPPGAGVLFKHVQSNMTANCIEHGWKELTFLSNQLPTELLCFGVGWYLSADFQLYIISFFVIMAMYKNAKNGLKLAILFIICGIGIQAYVLFLNPQFSPIMNFSNPDMQGIVESMPVLHMHTNNYIVPYFIGLISGYCIIRKIELPKEYYNLVWIISITSLSVPSVFMNMAMNSKIMSHLAGVFIGPIFRALVALGFGSFVYMTWLDQESFFNKFLSNNFFDRICRIIFPSFMMHMLVILHMLGSQTDTIEFNPMDIIMRVLYVLFFSFVLGYLLYIVVEAPFFNLTKQFMARSSSSTSSIDTVYTPEVSSNGFKPALFSNSSNNNNNNHVHAKKGA